MLELTDVREDRVSRQGPGASCRRNQRHPKSLGSCGTSQPRRQSRTGCASGDVSSSRALTTGGAGEQSTFSRQEWVLENQFCGCDGEERHWELPSTKTHTHACLQARGAKAEPAVLPFRVRANKMKRRAPHLGSLAPDVKPLGWGAM